MFNSPIIPTINPSSTPSPRNPNPPPLASSSPIPSKCTQKNSRSAARWQRDNSHGPRKPPTTNPSPSKNSNSSPPSGAPTIPPSPASTSPPSSSSASTRSAAPETKPAPLACSLTTP